MAATSDAVVKVTLDDPAARIEALTLAVRSRGQDWSDEETLETANAYLAFLVDDSTT